MAVAEFVVVLVEVVDVAESAVVGETDQPRTVGKEVVATWI